MAIEVVELRVYDVEGASELGGFNELVIIVEGVVGIGDVELVDVEGK